MFGEITEAKADELNAAWEAAGLAERLTMPRVSWIATDTVSYYVTQPSELEKKAAARIDELESEIAECRRELEDVLGTPPDASFSLHALVLQAVSALDAT